MNKYTLYLIFTLPLLILTALRLIGGFDGLYGQDAYEYYRYSIALKNFIDTGVLPGDYFWPIWYPLAGALLSFIIPDTALSLQIISAISLSFIFGYSLKLIQLFFPGKSQNDGIYIGLLIILSPFMLRFGLSVMADMFTAATLTIGTYHLFQFIKNKSIKGLCLAVLLYSISVMSRYAVAIIIVPFIFSAVYSFIKQKNKWYLVPPILFIGFLPIIPHIVIRAENPAGFIFHDWLTNWSPLNYVRANFTTRDGISDNYLPNILYAFGGLFHPRYFLAGILIVVIGFKKLILSAEVKIILCSILIYLLFLAGIPFQNNRFLLLVLPFLLIILYPAIQYTIGIMGKKWKPIVVSTLLMVQIVFFIFSFKKVWERCILEKEIYEYIVQNKTPAIYTMDMDISLKGRGYNPPIYNIYNNYFDSVNTKAVVLFNTEVFPKQWAGMNPMKNWEHLNKDYHLEQVRSFNAGWKIYVFK